MFLPFVAVMILHPISGLCDEPVVRVFQGVVTDSNGNPVHGAAVEWGHYLDARIRREMVRTDEEGNYWLETSKVGPDYRLGVSAIGFAPRWRDGLVPNAKEVKSAALILSSPSRLRFEEPSWIGAENRFPVSACWHLVLTSK